MSGLYIPEGKPKPEAVYIIETIASRNGTVGNTWRKTYLTALGFKRAVSQIRRAQENMVRWKAENPDRANRVVNYTYRFLVSHTTQWEELEGDEEIFQPKVDKSQVNPLL